MRVALAVAGFAFLVAGGIVAGVVLGTSTSEPAVAVPTGVAGRPTSTPSASGAAPGGPTSMPTEVPGVPAAASSAPTATGAPEPTAPPLHPIVDRRAVGAAWGEVGGLTTFRGNPTRTYYGAGPVPREPAVLWRYPDGPMCTVERLASGDEREWCGTGWTGQPLVRERPGQPPEVVFGAYDHRVHFLDGASGAPTRPALVTGHMVKGTEALDPDGYPLLYTGSRDGKLRVVALDRDAPTELWALEAHPQRVWNDDWDGSPAIVGDVMYVGGEDSWFYAVRLNRALGPDGLVTVAPEVLLATPGWTPALLAAVGDGNVSIESSVALYEGRAYFANSGGRVVGLDVTSVAETGAAPVVFDYWAGDDVDATITIDAEGMLYVAAELERDLPRARAVGQLLKLDPYSAGDPLVWSVGVPAATGTDPGGIWATPTLHRDVLYVSTHAGDLLGVDAGDGEVFYRERIGYHEWGSAAVVDDTLVVPLCEQGGLRAYDVTDPRAPVERWTLQLGGCVESTPAIHDGRIYVGSRDGFFYAVGDG